MLNESRTFDFSTLIIKGSERNGGMVQPTVYYTAIMFIAHAHAETVYTTASTNSQPFPRFVLPTSESGRGYLKALYSRKAVG